MACISFAMMRLKVAKHISSHMEDENPVCLLVLVIFERCGRIRNRKTVICDCNCETLSWKWLIGVSRIHIRRWWICDCNCETLSWKWLICDCNCETLSWKWLIGVSRIHICELLLPAELVHVAVVLHAELVHVAVVLHAELVQDGDLVHVAVVLHAELVHEAVVLRFCLGSREILLVFFNFFILTELEEHS